MDDDGRTSNRSAIYYATNCARPWVFWLIGRFVCMWTGPQRTTTKHYQVQTDTLRLNTKRMWMCEEDVATKERSIGLPRWECFDSSGWFWSTTFLVGGWLWSVGERSQRPTGPTSECASDGWRSIYYCSCTYLCLLSKYMTAWWDWLIVLNGREWSPCWLMCDSLILPVNEPNAHG